MRDDADVAVVIPCYNQGRFVEEALASVRAQRRPVAECVIVDDGSTDPATLGVLERLRQSGQRVIRQDNQGLPAARNAGVRATRAPFFVPLDADDRLRAGFVERLLPPLLTEPAVGYCYGHTRLFGAENRVWKCPAYDPDRLLVQNLSTTAAVVRRAAFDRVGGYNAAMREGFEDWDFWLRLLEAGYHGRCMPAVLFDYRRHPGGSMVDRAEARRTDLIRDLIRNHRALFAARLGAGASDAELEAAWQAQRELYALQDSRIWRTLRRLTGDPRLGQPDGSSGESTAPCAPGERLKRIEATRSYRLLQAVKRSWPYLWYARCAHGKGYLNIQGR